MIYYLTLFTRRAESLPTDPRFFINDIVIIIYRDLTSGPLASFKKYVKKGMRDYRPFC